MLAAADMNPPEDTTAFMAAFWNQVSDLDNEDGGPQKAGSGLRRFAEERVAGVLGELGEIDGIISGLLVGWTLDRLGTVERAVLRLAAWELQNCTDIPSPIVVNEAVDLAKWFSESKSGRFVNGVLDKFAKNVRTAPKQEGPEEEAFTP